MTKLFRSFYSLRKIKVNFVFRSFIRTFAARNWCCSDAVPISG